VVSLEEFRITDFENNRLLVYPEEKGGVPSIHCLSSSNIATKMVKGGVFSNGYWKNNPSARVSEEVQEVPLFYFQNKPRTLDSVEVRAMNPVSFFLK